MSAGLNGAHGGGIHLHGRQKRGAGFTADLGEHLEAALAGWRVVRLAPTG